MGSTPRLGMKFKKLKRKLKRSVPVAVPMAGLRRPRSAWSTSLLTHATSPRSASSGTAGGGGAIPPEDSPDSEGDHSFIQPDPDSDSGKHL